MLIVRQRQTGMTLIELMIGLVLGLIVTGLAINMYISTLGITSQTTNTVRLNQEMRAVMDLVVNDVRRAGYWAGDVTADNPHENVISGSGASALMHINVFDSPVAASGSSCVMLSYDYDDNGGTDPLQVFGYRLNDNSGVGIVQGVTLTVASGATAVTCSDGSWSPVTDERTVKVTKFELTRSNGLTAASWAAASAKGLTIDFEAEAVRDSRLKRQLIEEVRVRNEY